MWDSAFQVSTQLVTHALLCRPVLPSSGAAFEKVSAAMGVRAALNSRSDSRTLLFLVPEATSSTARNIAAALLVGHHAHSNAGKELPPEEVRPILKGDLLFITQAVSQSIGELQDLPLAHQRLRDLWDVVPLSRYAKSRGSKARVFVANPGWAATGTAGRRFGAVVIDASHPRTAEQLPDLIRIAKGCSGIRQVVAPPLQDRVLRACGYPESVVVWLWDAKARADAQAVSQSKDTHPPTLGSRHLWVCDSDTDASAALATVHAQLVATMRASHGAQYPGIRLAWGIYNRLRQLAVPLVQLEQVASRGWAGSLRQRIDQLDEVSGQRTVAWETTWPGLRDALREAYQLMLRREETAKFWGVAAQVETSIRAEGARLRVVVPSEDDGQLLRELLRGLVDSSGPALDEGRLEIVTHARESRLVAEGDTANTLLLGPRTNGYRYLDVYHSCHVDQMLYPHELEPETAAQGRLYEEFTHAISDSNRLSILAGMGLRPPTFAKASAPAGRPAVVVSRASGHPVKNATVADSAASLDVDSLVEQADRVGGGHGSWQANPVPWTSGGVVEVTFQGGGHANYYASQNVDVYFSESGEVHRHPAAKLQPGWHVVNFVDGLYDSLFARLTETVNARLSAKERVALELWDTAKARLVDGYATRRELYEKLHASGLTSGYETFTTWFRDGDEGVLAPQQFEEFEVLAKESGAYSAPKLLESTFKAVQHARGRNRAAGKKLKAFLRAVVSGDDYEEALDSARKIDTGLGDVLAAVQVLEVAGVTVSNRGR